MMSCTLPIVDCVAVNVEVKKALELKTKQLALFRHSKADQIPLNAITVLPMHLRGKFSEFLRSVLVQQKRFFETALKDFVANKITDRELTYHTKIGDPRQLAVEANESRKSLLIEIGKIGNSLAYDYMSELELRLNGTFSQSQDTRYKLNDGGGGGHGGGGKILNGASPLIQGKSGGSRLEPRPLGGGTHTPMGSYGSTHSLAGSGANVSGTHSAQTSSDSTKQRVKTGAYFDKAKKLLARKRPKDESGTISQGVHQQLTPQQPSPQPPGSAPTHTSPQVLVFGVSSWALPCDHGLGRIQCVHSLSLCILWRELV